ncbi:MAG: AraC family transcriptional regulator ligand-binding domain-containing protein [Terracidiphilus sp.]|jgi:AraC-like DNA-binding protein
MTKHFRVASGLRSKLEESGVQASAVLRTAGLPRDFFDQPRILVNTQELFALWRAIGEVSKDSSIGLKMGTETKLERFHPSGIAVLSAETFGAGIEYMAKYKKLSAPEEILQEKCDGEWAIRFRWTLAVEVEPPALIENCFAWLLSIARQGTGTRLSPLRVELVQTRGHIKQLERHFGCTVNCGAARNAMVFRATDAELPFVTRNSELLEMLAPQFEQELKQRYADEENTFIELVRGAIQQRLTGKRPSIDEIADDLHMSSRTLQRRLQDSGWSFQRVLDDARRQLARYYLSNSVLELGEAAYLLGYEDANSFARAFRGWEGVPPRYWRESHRETAIQ